MGTLLARTILLSLILAPCIVQGADAKRRGREARINDFRFMCDEIDRKCPPEMRALKGVDWRQVRAEYEPLAAKARNEEEFVKLCVEVIGKLRDGHAYVDCKEIPSDKIHDPAENMSPGAGLVECAGGKIAVLSVRPGSSAAGAGMKRGAVLISIDGVAAAEALDNAAKERWERGYFSSERGARFNAAWTLLSGRKDSTVRIEFDPGNGKARKATLKRNSPRLLRCPKIGDYPGPGALKDEGGFSWMVMGGKYGYIYMPRFAGADGGKAAILKILDQMQAVKGLVLDIRGNGGGGVPDVAFPQDKHIVLLIDPGTISAGEGFAAWFGISKANPKGHPSLVIAGQATAGSSSEKMAIEVPSGLFTFHFSFRGRKGQNNCGPGGLIEYYGVKPHKEVLQDAADLASDEDTCVKAAIAILDSKAGK